MDKDKQQEVLDGVSDEIRLIVSREFGAVWERTRQAVEARWPGATAITDKVTGHLLRMTIAEVLAFMCGHVERTIMETSEVKSATLVSMRNRAVKDGRMVDYEDKKPASA